MQNKKEKKYCPINFICGLYIFFICFFKHLFTVYLHEQIFFKFFMLISITVFSTTVIFYFFAYRKTSSWVIRYSAVILSKIRIFFFPWYIRTKWILRSFCLSSLHGDIVMSAENATKIWWKVNIKLQSQVCSSFFRFTEYRLFARVVCQRAYRHERMWNITIFSFFFLGMWEIYISCHISKQGFHSPQCL